jgi:hypothetical protein
VRSDVSDSTELVLLETDTEVDGAVADCNWEEELLVFPSETIAVVGTVEDEAGMIVVMLEDTELAADNAWVMPVVELSSVVDELSVADQLVPMHLRDKKTIRTSLGRSFRGRQSRHWIRLCLLRGLLSLRRLGISIVIAVWIVVLGDRGTGIDAFDTRLEPMSILQAATALTGGTMPRKNARKTRQQSHCRHEVDSERWGSHDERMSAPYPYQQDVQRVRDKKHYTFLLFTSQRAYTLGEETVRCKRMDDRSCGMTPTQQRTQQRSKGLKHPQSTCPDDGREQRWNKEREEREREREKAARRWAKRREGRKDFSYVAERGRKADIEGSHDRNKTVPQHTAKIVAIWGTPGRLGLINCHSIERGDTSGWAQGDSGWALFGGHFLLLRALDLLNSFRA